MFLLNKYTRWYTWIIVGARKRTQNTGYTELHHITPRSLGGSDSPYNVVRLTAREHYLAHYLLTRMCVEVSDSSKMWNAFFLMHVHSTDQRTYRSRTYEISKRKMSESKKLLRGNQTSFFGRKHSEETRRIMREKRVGRVCRRDYTVYKFYHPDHGEISATQKELYSTFDLCNKGVNSIVKIPNKTYKRWRLKP